MQFQTCSLVRIILMLCASLQMSLPTAASDDLARQWLGSSDQVKTNWQPSGVGGHYEQVQLQLVQSLGFAALGDIHETVQRLPLKSDGDSWTSGGDGMVRQLVVGDTLRHIHRTIFRSLQRLNQSEEAFTYVNLLTPAQSSPDIYFLLGRHTADATQGGSLQAAPLAQFQLGQVVGLLADNNRAKAHKLLERMEPQHRDKTLRQITQLLMLDGDWDEAMTLYQLSGLEAGTAVSVAVHAGKLDAAETLLTHVDQSQKSQYSVTLALGYAQAGRLDEARQLFDAFQDSKNRRWESVALMISADEWLLAYYGGLTDPWRRAERLYQMARRLWQEDEPGRAQQIASLALTAADKIPSATTRSLAYQQLAAFHALARDPATVNELIKNIPNETATLPYYMDARIELVVAYAADGQADEAISQAGNIEPSGKQAMALIRGAEVSMPNRSSYQSLVQEARNVCTTLQEKATAEEAWKALVEMQIRARDHDGAASSATLASRNAHGNKAWQAIVQHANASGQFEAALTATQQLIDEARQHDQQKAIQMVVEAAAAAGDTQLALKALSRISQPHIRDLSAPPVARALAAAGLADAAADLIDTIKRADAREAALSVVLFTHAQQHQHPPAKLLNKVPRRSGAGLCWAAAASARTEPADARNVENWLDQLTHPGCRAFAYAGAAFVLLHGDDNQPDAEVLLGLVDPTRVTERMTEAMRRSAVFQR